jgi:hypothetical protein
MSQPYREGGSGGGGSMGGIEPHGGHMSPPYREGGWGWGGGREEEEGVARTRCHTSALEQYQHVGRVQVWNLMVTPEPASAGMQVL